MSDIYGNSQIKAKASLKKNQQPSI